MGFRRFEQIHDLDWTYQFDIRYCHLHGDVVGVHARPDMESLFQSGWFVEGLLSQTLIVHMIRTRKVSSSEFCLMACDADDLLHHGNRPLYSVHHIRQFDRPDSSSMDLLSMAHRHSAVLLRIDAMAQNPLYQGFQTLVVM